MRIDKYDPISGGTRAPLAADWTGSETAKAVGLDTNGRVVAGAGTTGIIGVLCKHDDAKAGDVVDVMTAGELADCTTLDPGTVYTANTTTGVISSGAISATQVLVGFCSSDYRLVVRITPGIAAVTALGVA